jgi:N-acetylmuramoyl-L-alanine amidase
MLPIYALVLSGLFVGAICGSRVVTTLSENAPFDNRRCVIIDAGHGGEDGGAVSCTGAHESQINLEIALRLNDLLQLLGIDTVMIRTTDRSIYTQGSTLALKKASDLKERVRIANSIDNAIVLSIHQNMFQDGKYNGAQVFYASTPGSKELAGQIQSVFKQSLNPGSNRSIKRADSVYLMQHIKCTGVLVECGFLSNAAEEALLRNSAYQQKICCVLASALSQNLHGSA